LKPLIGYQVYSARWDAEKDLGATLAEIAKIGYDGVEFAGFYGNSAEDVAQMLKDNGLVAASSHVPFVQILDDPDGVIAYHKAIGCKFIAIPHLGGGLEPGGKDFAKTIRAIYAFGKKCRDAGIQLLYHNHDFEFVTVCGQYGLDFLYDAVDEDLLKTEIDTCWVKYAGEDPVAYVKKYAGRAPVVHLKDYVGVKSDRPPYALIGVEGSEPKDDVPFMFKPFGCGCQDAKAVVDAAIEAGAGWVIVEQDESPERAPLEAAKISLDNVKNCL